MRFPLTPEEDAAWQNCYVADCPNKVCLGLSNTLCYPHATRKQMDKEGNATIPVTLFEVNFWRRNVGLPEISEEEWDER